MAARRIVAPACASGRALAQCVGPAANIYVNFSLGLEAVREIVERTIGEAGLASVARDQIALGLGLAGLSNAADAFRVTTALPGWARVEAVNDAVTACIGASGLAEGGWSSLELAQRGSHVCLELRRSLAGVASCWGTTERERALGPTRFGRRSARTTASNR